jgi:hypothetical protein
VQVRRGAHPERKVFMMRTLFGTSCLAGIITGPTTLAPVGRPPSQKCTI